MQLSRQYSGVGHNVLLPRIHCASTSLSLSVRLAVCSGEETLTCTCLYTFMCLILHYFVYQDKLRVWGGGRN